MFFTKNIIYLLRKISPISVKRWNRYGSAPGNQQSSQATAVDSCFAPIKTQQYNLAGSCYKTDLINHNMYKWEAMKQG